MTASGKRYYIAKVIYDTDKAKFRVKDTRRLQLPAGAQTQLDFDWTPFTVRAGGALGNHLKLIASVDPFVVYDLNIDTGELTELVRQKSDIGRLWSEGKLGTIRGGSTVQYDKDEDRYLMFFHSQTRRPFPKLGPSYMVGLTKNAYMGALAFKDTSIQGQPGYALRAVTPEPLLHLGWYATYNAFSEIGPKPGGLSVHPDGAADGGYVLNCGVRRTGIDIVQLGISPPMDSMVSVSHDPVLPNKLWISMFSSAPTMPPATQRLRSPIGAPPKGSTRTNPANGNPPWNPSTAIRISGTQMTNWDSEAPSSLPKHASAPRALNPQTPASHSRSAWSSTRVKAGRSNPCCPSPIPTMQPRTMKMVSAPTATPIRSAVFRMPSARATATT